MNFRGFSAPKAEPKVPGGPPIPRWNSLPAPLSPARQTLLGKGLTINGQVFTAEYVLTAEDVPMDGIVQTPFICKEHSVTRGRDRRVVGCIEAKGSSCGAGSKAKSAPSNRSICALVPLSRVPVGFSPCRSIARQVFGAGRK